MRLIFLFVLFFARTVSGQNYGNVLSIQILDTTLVTHINTPQQRISFQFQIKNDSNSILLLYGINGGVRNMPVKADRLWDNKEKMSAGVALYIYNEEMKKLGVRKPMISEEIDHKPMPKEKLDSIFMISRSKYLKGTKVIGSFETITLEKEIDVKNYNLKKGIYYIQIAYFSGSSILSMVDKQQLEEDKRVYKASVYYGCAVSNVVKFVVP